MSRKFRTFAFSALVALTCSGLAAGCATSVGFITTTSMITVNAPSFVQSTIGQALSMGVSAKAPGTAAFTYSATNLPEGMGIDPSTGLISGTPRRLARNTVTVTATDGAGASGTASMTWQVGAQIAVGRGNAGSGMGNPVFEGQTVEVPLAVSDNAAPRDTLTYHAVRLPPGVRLDPARLLITGWPTESARYQSEIIATGLDGGSGALGLATAVLGPDAGAVGPVRLNLGGKCLNDNGNRAAAGGKVGIWSCDGGAAQQWTYESDGSLQIHGLCLDTAGHSTAANAGLELGTCGPGTGQWDNDTGGQLRDLRSGYCVTDPAGSTVNGTQLTITGCAGGASREWTLPAEMVHSAIAGRCLDDSRASPAHGAEVGQSTCNGTDFQTWVFESDGTIRAGGKCLDTGNTATSGGKINLWACDGSTSQQWAVTGINGSLGLELRHGTMCASPSSMTAAKGAQLALEACGTDQSYWHAW